jgi:hypothetical protein
MSNNQLSKALVTIAAMALPATAAAYMTPLVGGGCSGGGYGTLTCTGGDGTVVASAHAFTGSSGTVMEGAFLGLYSGLGVTADGSAPKESPSSPQHALDNDGFFEYILIDFLASRILDKVVTSWVDTDADITVLAKTGGSDPDPNGKTVAGLTGAGWTLVGHYDGTNDDGQTIDVNAGGVPARYWLIGAYHPDPGFVGPTIGEPSYKPHKGKFDYLKVYAVKWDEPTDAAEPATLLLFAAGLIAFLSGRRRTARI